MSDDQSSLRSFGADAPPEPLEALRRRERDDSDDEELFVPERPLQGYDDDE